MAIDTCCVCLGQERTHALVPCFHFCVCQGCAAHLLHCPLCRAEVQSIQRVYL